MHYFGRFDERGLAAHPVFEGHSRGYTAAPLLDSDGLRQLFEMRRLLEPYATRNAAGER